MKFEDFKDFQKRFEQYITVAAEEEEHPFESDYSSIHTKLLIGSPISDDEAEDDLGHFNQKCISRPERHLERSETSSSSSEDSPLILDDIDFKCGKRSSQAVSRRSTEVEECKGSQEFNDNLIQVEIQL